MSLPIISDTVRPYRLWDCKERRNVPHRCYSDPRRAVMGALLLAAWGRVGTRLEIYDTRDAHAIGLVHRRIKSIDFARYSDAI